MTAVGADPIADLIPLDAHPLLPGRWHTPAERIVRVAAWRVIPVLQGHGATIAELTARVTADAGTAIRSGVRTRAVTADRAADLYALLVTGDGAAPPARPALYPPEAADVDDVGVIAVGLRTRRRVLIVASVLTDRRAALSHLN